VEANTSRSYHNINRKKPQQDVHIVFHFVGKLKGKTFVEVVVIIDLLNEMTSHGVGSSLSYLFPLSP
jgi:hypothetical protein